MKKITIYQRGASDVEILDDSDETIDVYCQELSKVFNMSNVVILKTSTSTFIGRPSQLAGVVVEDTESQTKKTIESKNVPNKIVGKSPKKHVDIITDVD